DLQGTDTIVAAHNKEFTGGQETLERVRESLIRIDAGLSGSLLTHVLTAAHAIGSRVAYLHDFGNFAVRTCVRANHQVQIGTPGDLDSAIMIEAFDRQMRTARPKLIRHQ